MLFIFLAIPWWAYFPLAGGVAWLGERAQLSVLASQEERAEALLAGAPAPVDIARFDAAQDGTPSGEVTLRGWINADLTGGLALPAVGEADGARSLVLLFGENDPAGAGVARGAIVLEDTERAALESMLDTFPFDADRRGYVVEINGLLQEGAPYTDRVFAAIAEQGVRPTPDFVFVSPFLNGRAAALVPDEDDRTTREVFWLIAAVIAFVGVAKRVLSVLCAGARCNPQEASDGSEPGDESVSAGEGALEAVRSVTHAEEAHRSETGPEAPKTQPAALDHSDLTYYAGLAAAMVFVGSLSYDPAFALRYVWVLALLFLVFRFSLRILRRKAQRGEERAL